MAQSDRRGTSARRQGGDRQRPAERSQLSRLPPACGRCRDRLLAQVDLVAAQNPLYADRFFEIGAPTRRVYVTGSLKFDGAQTDRDNPATVRLRQLAGFRRGDTIFLAGSTQDPEEQLALDAFRQLAAEHPELAAGARAAASRPL